MYFLTITVCGYFCESAMSEAYGILANFISQENECLAKALAIRISREISGLILILQTGIKQWRDM